MCFAIFGHLFCDLWCDVTSLKVWICDIKPRWIISWSPELTLLSCRAALIGQHPSYWFCESVDTGRGRSLTRPPIGQSRTEWAGLKCAQRGVQNKRALTLSVFRMPLTNWGTYQDFTVLHWLGKVILVPKWNKWRFNFIVLQQRTNNEMRF